MISGRTIEIKEGGVRLDAAVLHAFPTTTRAFVRDAIDNGTILLLNKGAIERSEIGEALPESFPLQSKGESFPLQSKGESFPLQSKNFRHIPKGTKLHGGEVIEIRELLEAEDNLVAPVAGPLSVEFEDAALLAFDKPAGMPVQPLSCRETGTLMNAVVARYPECRALGDAPLMAGALHRIDADTSGLVLVARTAEAFANLRAQFSAQTVKKTYLALVEGSVAVGGTLENELVHDPTLPFCRMIDVRGMRDDGRGMRQKLKPLHAVTSFKPIGYVTVESEERTLLEVEIFTGVTHQIRAQLALAGMHIVNDRLYGAFAIENQTGHCLHALAAEFTHPVSHDPVAIRTAYPSWAQL